MRFLAVIISLLFLIVGGKLCLTGDKMYDEAQVFPAAEQITYQKFAQERPLVGWYQISGAVVDLTEAAHKSTQVNADAESRPTPADLTFLARSKDVYVPVHDVSAPNASAELILLTRDVDLGAAVRAVAAGPNVDAHTTAPRIVRGMVRAPSELPDEIRRVLGNCITTQTIIVEEYATPSVARSVQTMAAGGAMIFSVALLWLYIWRHDRKPIYIPEEFLAEEADFEEDL